VSRTLKLLLAEDDVSLGEGIRAGLALDDYNVDWVADGESADRRLQEEHFDVVLLDLGLPRRHGIDVLRAMRSRGDDTPILVLTALDSVADRIAGLDAGGDDYLTKPFDLDELSARVRALHRRHTGSHPAVLTHGAVTLDLVASRVLRDGKPVNCSPHEFALLRLLLEQVGRVLPRRKLEEVLYGWEADVESNTVEVHIHFLRKKLGEDLIRTVRGVGYVIDRDG
jgi:two-component system response regulator QseB